MVIAIMLITAATALISTVHILDVRARWVFAARATVSAGSAVVHGAILRLRVFFQSTTVTLRDERDFTKR